MDETPIIVENHQGYGLIRNDSVCIHTSHTRSAVVPEQRYWFCLDKPLLSTDLQDTTGLSFGSGADRIFYGRQSILQATMLYEKMRMLFHETKQMGPLIPSTLLLTGQDVLQSKLDSKFGTKLGNAANNLYTFVSHLRMYLTTSLRECYVWW